MMNYFWRGTWFLLNAKVNVAQHVDNPVRTDVLRCKLLGTWDFRWSMVGNPYCLSWLVLVQMRFAIIILLLYKSGLTECFPGTVESFEVILLQLLYILVVRASFILVRVRYYLALGMHDLLTFHESVRGITGRVMNGSIVGGGN